MFGEFFASVKQNITCPVDEKNRYWFPNMLEPIGLNCKNFLREEDWPISASHRQVLNEHYGDKEIYLPTHWYNDIAMTKLAHAGIRIYSDTIKLTKLAYVLWWLKSHLYVTDPWPGRWRELQSMIDNDHEYKDDLIELKHRYHNWKFLCYKNNILLDGKPNLKHYMSTYYEMYLQGNSRIITGYDRYPASQILKDHASYAEENWLLIEQRLNVNNLGEDFLDILHEYAKLYCLN